MSAKRQMLIDLKATFFLTNDTFCVAYRITSNSGLNGTMSVFLFDFKKISFCFTHVAWEMRVGLYDVSLQYLTMHFELIIIINMYNER